MVDTQIIANAPVSFLVAGMGDALGTYFEGRASIRTESPSLREPALPGSMAPLWSATSPFAITVHSN